MSPKENSDRSNAGSKRGDNASRSSKPQKNRGVKKSEANNSGADDELVVKTTSRRPKPEKESPVPSAVPRYNPSIRDAKRPDVPPPPVGYMMDDDEEDNWDNLYDFDSEDMQQTVADRQTKGRFAKRDSRKDDDRADKKPREKNEFRGERKNRDEKDKSREKDRDGKKSRESGKDRADNPRSEKRQEEKSRSDKPRAEKPRTEKKDKDEQKPRSVVKTRESAAAATAPAETFQPAPAPVEQEPASASTQSSSLLAEIKRKLKEELIEELRKELQEELREELKQELGLGKAKSSKREKSERFSSDSNSESTEKKTPFQPETESLADSTGKKKAVLVEDGEDKQNEETVELVDSNQKSQGKFRKIPVTVISTVLKKGLEPEAAPVKPVLSEESPSVPTEEKAEKTGRKKPIQKPRAQKSEFKSPVEEAPASDVESVSIPEAPQEKPVDKRLGKKGAVKSKPQAAPEVSQEAQSALSDKSDSKANEAAWAHSKFHPFSLKPEIMRALHEFGYLEPTPIQQGVIPVAGQGRDVMGQAQTGTGKTAAFSLPILQKLEFNEEIFAPRALILVPTRELAVQVRDEIKRLGKYAGLAIAAFYGGAPLQKQTVQLSDGVDIAVGTPGRVIDLFNRKSLNLSQLEFVVLDEADRMLDIGFRPDIEKILRRCPDSRQTLLMSATIPPQVDKLARNYMNNPEKLDFSPKNLAVETIEQFYFSVAPERKIDLLKSLLKRENPHQAIIFCRTKRRTEQLTGIVKRWYPDAEGMHGDMDQGKRMRTIEQFRAGKVRILVATDVVGRGLDISGISHIINYDIPQFCDDYVHRVGRTGRMGREGVAYTFVTAEEGVELTRIEMRINRLLKRDEIEGFTAFKPPVPSVIPPEGDKFHADEAVSEEAPKPVYGQHTRRVRRAL